MEARNDEGRLLLEYTTNDGDGFTSIEETQCLNLRKSQLLYLSCIVALVSATLSAFATATVLHFSWISRNAGFTSYSPAQAALKYRSRVAFDNRLYPNQFIGEPRAEVDEAWFQLLRNPYFRVTESEYSKLLLNDTTIGITGSADKVISFSVYHELHCLKTLYKWIHADHYFPSLTNNSQGYRLQKWHAEHCISYLRQASMCTASLTPITLEWYESTPGDPRPLPNPYLPRQCADWRSLDLWAAERKVDLYNLDSLADMPGRGW